MSVQVDPIILQKLEDFRRRRRNLIFLRGFCSAVVSLLAVFSTIAVADYLVSVYVKGGMPDEVRTALSYIGYGVVVFAVWRTCARLLIHLPSRRHLARLIEQTAPDLREDLLSAVELGRDDGAELDSEVFRNLVQKDVSSRVKDLDMSNALPLTRLRRWLQATAALIVFTFVLLNIPDFGGQFQQLMGRALLPGANIAPLTDIEVAILAPNIEKTITPKSEPLRFLVEVKGKDKDQTFGRVELETKIKNAKLNPVAMAPRQANQFSLDYNVDREKFEYRIWVDGSPRTKWFDMDVASRPYVTSFTKTYRYPEYTKLEPITATEDRGDLSGWEGTEVDLVLNTNQVVTEGTMELDLTGGGLSKLQLSPTDDGKGLKTTLVLEKPGTYHTLGVTSQETGWKSKPSQAYEIAVQLDEAPAIRIVSPEEKSQLLAPDDILALTAVAEDDLALEKIEFHVRVNNRGWQKFPVPGLETPIDEKNVVLQFDLDLLELKLRPNDSATLKLVAYDRKGAIGESDPIQLSIISRDLDLSAIQTIKLKSLLVEGVTELAEAAEARAKENNELYSTFLKKNSEPISGATADSMRSLTRSLVEESTLLFDQTLTTLTAMPRGTDSLEVALVTRAVNAINQLRPGIASTYAEMALASEDPKIRKQAVQDLKGSIESDKGLLGNLRNMAKVILDQQVLAVGTTYLRQLLKNQGELIELAKGEYHYKLVARRQEVALNHWRTIENVFKAGSNRRTSATKQISKQEGSLRAALDAETPDRAKLASEIAKWNDSVRRFYEVEQNLLRSRTRSLRSNRENFLWQVRDSWHDIDEFAQKITLLNSNENEYAGMGRILGDRQWPALVSELQGRSRLEESRKDADSAFVKDTGQASRALQALGNQFRSQISAGEETVVIATKIREIAYLFRLLEAYHQVVEASGLASTFANKEKWEMMKSNNRADRAIHWATAASPWRALSGKIAGIPLDQLGGSNEDRNEAAKILRDLHRQPYATAIGTEMQKRVENLEHKP
ncbi:MAG: hypothetical protein HOB63_06845, partial [Opitutae bacterium]|nr:hypothetical protein [Opitutae bacterium]